VLQVYPELQEEIRSSADPLLTACKLAVAGNIMDFGAKESFDIKETIQRVLESDFALNAYPEFKDALESASSLLFLADNAGELVCDKLLLETILHYYPLKHITLVVKDEPIINDATLVDVEEVGLASIPGIEFRTLGPLDAFDERNQSLWPLEKVKVWAQEHDLVLSKGQANYEMFGEMPGFFFLLLAKCDILAEITGTHLESLLFIHNDSA
jgi:uncharacterized protein with ATP-grasp and redox domains